MREIQGRKRCILFVDDSPSARAVVRSTLGRRGYEVILAKDTQELDAALDRTRPDLLLLDVHLPEILGSDLVPWLRTAKRLDRPIVLLSDDPPAALARLAAESGADGWISKASRPDELAAQVERWFAPDSPA